jgi:hypothetical protein
VIAIILQCKEESPEVPQSMQSDPYAREHVPSIHKT